LSSLPAGCPAGRTPPASAILTFVSGGRAWAVAPDDPSTLTCLFSVSAPGYFSWGPRGDRVLLSGLEVRGVGSSVSRPARDISPAYFSWSRPTGTTVIFTDAAMKTIQRADMGTGDLDAITPLTGVTYGDLAYHPSGLAIGFVANGTSASEIWMSTNQGKEAVLLVRADPNVRFGHIAFAHDGTHLFYSVDGPASGAHRLANVDITTGAAKTAWTGTTAVRDIVELAATPGAGLTVGGGCQDARAVYSGLDGSAGQNLLPDATTSTAVVGRLDADRFVVSAGGCNGPSDLYVAPVSGGSPKLLISGVQAAALRQAEPTPAPPLPPALPRSPFA
jgi:hypothetical protein